MMGKLRENTKIILWVVVVAFVMTIFAVWGLDLQTGSAGSDPNVIGKINGVPVTLSQYQFTVQAMRQQFQADPSVQLTFSQEELIRNQAWDQMILAILTEQVIQDLGIAVSDNEIVYFLRNSPPAEVRQYFLDENGAFDNQAYQTALNNPEIDWTSLEQLARQRIPRIKLNDYLTSHVHVSEAEIRKAYDQETVDLTIEYVEFSLDASDLGEYTPTTEEIQTYYDEHADEFIDPEKVRLEFAQIELVPSPADMDDAEFTAFRVREKLDAGEDFAELAKTYSEATTSVVGGNTGFIRRGHRDDAYFDALPALDIGQTSDLIETDDGFYVVTLRELRPDDEGGSEYNLQEILIKPALSRQTSDSLFTFAARVSDRAAEVGLQTACEELSVTLVTPDPFPQNGIIGNVGLVPSLSAFAFDEEVDALSDVLRDEFRLYVARIVERFPKSQRPLEGLKTFIETRLTFEKGLAVAELNANAFYLKTKNTSMEEAAETYNAEISRPDPFNAIEPLDKFGANSVVAEAALTVTKGQVAPPVRWASSYVVVNVLDKSELDLRDYRSRVKELRDRLKNQKAQEYITYWYDKLKSDSDIEDYRQGI